MQHGTPPMTQTEKDRLLDEWMRDYGDDILRLCFVILQDRMLAEDASQETIDSAMRAISAMASDSMTETQIENLLLAKDFSECVVYITDDGITVAVPAPADGLSTAQVATITDVIVSETDYTAPQIKVIEVKADAQ